MAKAACADSWARRPAPHLALGAPDCPGGVPGRQHLLVGGRFAPARTPLPGDAWPGGVQPVARSLQLTWYRCTISDGFELGVATVMEENEAPVSSGQPDPFPFLDRAGYASLVGGLLVVLITFLTSYSHVEFLGIRFNVNQQIGVPVLLAAVAALVGEVKLASNDRCADQRARDREARVREREANEAARDRDRKAREREQAALRSRIQARCLVAQCRFLLADTALNRLQLSEALAVLIDEIKLSEP